MKARTLLMTAAAFIMAATAANAEVVATGNCGAEGNNVTWTLDEQGTLTLEGTGATATVNVSTTDQPWYNYVSQITNVVVNEGITDLGSGLFFNMNNITSVSLPSSLKSIGRVAFRNCTSISTIVSKAASAPTAYENTFLAVPSTAKVIVPAGSSDSYKNADYWSAFTIVEVVASGNCGAEGNNVTWTLDDQGTLTLDGTGATTTVNVSNTDQPWYNYVSQITNVVVNEGITDLGSGIFFNMNNITSVSLPSSLKSIRSVAFRNCTSLNTIVSKAASAPTAQENTFLAVPSTAKVIVPAGSSDSYKNADYWSAFTNIVEEGASAVEETAAVNAYAVGGTIYVDAEDYTIYDLAGQDVTAENGSLNGLYVVKVGNDCVKLIVNN